tara:strand:+ start:393 stop:560 length:168 start_codon:yes stop_codon:yes gene_type:complete
MKHRTGKTHFKPYARFIGNASKINIPQDQFLSANKEHSAEFYVMQYSAVIPKRCE